MTEPEGRQPEVSAGQQKRRGANRKQPEPTGSHKLGPKLGQKALFRSTREEFRRQGHEQKREFVPRRTLASLQWRLRSPEGRASWPVQLRLGRRKLSSVSQAQDHPEPVSDRSLTLAELAELQHAEPVEIDELVSDIWESDEELDAFLSDLRTSRNSSVA